MLTNKKPGKKIKEICAKLGKPYTICCIDLENVIYRNLENHIDFEISGLDNQKSNFNANLYIWDTTNGTGVSAKTIDQVMGISSLESLKSVLDAKVIQYQNGIH